MRISFFFFVPHSQHEEHCIFLATVNKVTLPVLKLFNLQLCFTFLNPLAGQPSTGHRKGPPHHISASLNAQSAPAQNCLNPGTHSISVLSSISPATGYFGEQRSQDATQNSIIPPQMQSAQGAQSLSSKQQKLPHVYF